MTKQAPKETTHVAVLLRTQRQLAILKSVRGSKIYELVGECTEKAWEEAKAQGLVTDAMLSPSPSKKNAQRAVILAA